MYAKRVIKILGKCCSKPHIYTDFLLHLFGFSKPLRVWALYGFSHLWFNSSFEIVHLPYAVISYTVLLLSILFPDWPGLTQDPPLEKHVNTCTVCWFIHFQRKCFSSATAFPDCCFLFHRIDMNRCPIGKYLSHLLGSIGDRPKNLELSQLDLRNPHLQLWGIPFFFISHSMV